MFGRILLVIFISSSFFAVAQDPEPHKVVQLPDTSELWVNPGIKGGPRSKGVIIRQERVHDYVITSDSQNKDIPDNRSQVRRNKRWDYKLRLPVISKPSFTFALGVNYHVEEYSFRQPEILTNPFQISLEDKPLRRVGATAYIVKPSRKKHYFLFRGSVDLNGDYKGTGTPDRNYLRISASPMLGWKVNDNLSWAVGLAYGYKFGRELIVPVIMYNRNFNPKWTLEATLPTRVKVRYNLNPKTYLYGTTELNGANYLINLDDPALNGYNRLYLQKAEWRNLLTLEREIYNFLWLSLDAGVRTNINFNLTETPRSRRQVIIHNHLSEAFMFSFGVFVVPPKKMMKNRN